MEPKEIVKALVTALVLALGLLIAVKWPIYRELSKCDDAIKTMLKAPSTYERISPTIWNSGDYISKIEYDAQNGFGVPVRGRGVCITGDDSATWLESPETR